MTNHEASNQEVREEAARLAFAMLRFASTAGHPRLGTTPSGALKVGTEAWVFGPSWQKVPNEGVVAFLSGLSSPALLNPTLSRGEIVLTLVDELAGERRRWAEKTLSNLVDNLDSMVAQSGLPPTARILVEFDEESHVFSLDAVREWAGNLAVNVGWNIVPLENEDRADACLGLVRADDREFPGRSCMMRERYRQQRGAV